MALLPFNYGGELEKAVVPTQLYSNLDNRAPVDDLKAIADVGVTARKIVNCNSNTLNTPYKDGLSAASAGTAYINMSSPNHGTILYVASAEPELYLLYKNSSGWQNWEKVITNADFVNKTISNTYGLSVKVFTFGNDNIKALKLGGYINTELKAGTAYTIATDAALKSRDTWYHNVFAGSSVDGSDIICYIRIDTSGNILLTPKTNLTSGTGINLMEYYV